MRENSAFQKTVIQNEPSMLHRVHGRKRQTFQVTSKKFKSLKCNYRGLPIFTKVHPCEFSSCIYRQQQMQHSYPNRCQDGNLVDPFDVSSTQLPAPAGDTGAEEGRFSVREAEAKGDGVIQKSRLSREVELCRETLKYSRLQ